MRGKAWVLASLCLAYLACDELLWFLSSLCRVVAPEDFPFCVSMLLLSSFFRSCLSAMLAIFHGQFLSSFLETVSQQTSCSSGSYTIYHIPCPPTMIPEAQTSSASQIGLGTHHAVTVLFAQ